MNYLSVASGIEAASVAWHPLGWRARALAQFDPEHDYSRGVLDFPSTVLRHHYPDVPNLGDMTKFKEWPDYANLDVLVGGTPCQTFSVAGLGAGLDDPRGNLMLTYVAIARRYRPTWVAWENVPGVLSNDRGRSFATLLACLSGQRIDVPAGGWRTAGFVPGIAGAYGLAWRVLDTQFVRVDGFGRAIPQRRRRVFVVGYLGDYRRAAAVLLEPESMSRNPPPSRRSGEKVAGALSASSGKRGGVDDPERGGLIPVVAPTLLSMGNRTGGNRQPGMDIDTVHSLIPVPPVANPLTARMGKGVNTTMDEGQTMIPMAFQPRFARNDRGAPSDVAYPLTAEAGRTGKGDSAQCVIVPDEAVAFKASHYTRGKDGAPAPASPPLSADADKGDQDTLILAPDPIAFDCKAGGETGFAIGDVPGALRGEGHGGGHAAIAFQSNAGSQGFSYGEGVSIPLKVGGEGLSSVAVALHDAMRWRVRRLMPIECERLQGLPDGYTDVMWRGKPAADGPRYKALGNSMSANVMRWLAIRIQMVSEIE